MIRALLLALAALFAGSAAYGQAGIAPYQPMFLAPLYSSCIGYVGPGDIAGGGFAWYGLRAYDCNTANGLQNAVNVRRASDSTTQDIKILAGGDFDAASAATFAGTDATCTASAVGTTTLTVTSCASGTLHVNDPISGTGITQPAYITAIGTCGSGSGTCTLNAAQTFTSRTVTAQVALFVKIIYDQTHSTHDIGQSTAATQPQLLLNCLGGKPCMLGSGAQQLNYLDPSVTFTGISVGQPFTWSMVAERIGNFTTGSYVTGDGTTNYGTGFSSATGDAQLAAGGVTSANFAASNSALHAMQVLFNTSSSKANVDGTLTTGLSVGNGSVTPGIYILAVNNLAFFIKGYVAEVGGWRGDASTNFTSLCHNQFTYWATVTSC